MYSLAFWFGSAALKDVSIPSLFRPKKQKKAQVLLDEKVILTRIAKDKRAFVVAPMKEASVNAIERDPEYVNPNRDAFPDFPKANTNEPATPVSKSEESVVKVETVTKLQSVQAEQQGVLLKVESAQRTGSTVALQVILQNKSGRSVRFLYSPAFALLKVSDDRGQELVPFTSGLPAIVPPDGQNYSGVIEVAIDPQDKPARLNLSLADKLDGKLQLGLSGIVVP
ncbi:MAG: hypothetical protein WCA07_17640 [Gloeobacterales cyanobacterium]